MDFQRDYMWPFWLRVVETVRSVMPDACVFADANAHHRDWDKHCADSTAKHCKCGRALHEWATSAGACILNKNA